MNRIKRVCNGSVTGEFQRLGHTIQRTKVPVSFFKDLSGEQCNLLALTTYPLAKKRMVYVFSVVLLVLASLIYTILAFTQGYSLFIVSSDATVLARYGDVGLGVLIVSVLLAVFTFPAAENALSGFYIVDGAKRLRFNGFVRFLYGFARILTYVFGFLLILAIGLFGGTLSGGENTVVIGLPYNCEPENVREIYDRLF